MGEYLERAEKAGLEWLLPGELSEGELFRRLFPENKEIESPTRQLPNWEEMQRELSKCEVTLSLLWKEY